MNVLQTALMAAQIASVVWGMAEPLAMKGLDALIADMKAKQASKTTVSMHDIKAMAAKHDVDMVRVLAVAEPTIMGLANAHAQHGTAPGKMGVSFGGFFSSIGSFFTQLRDFLASPQTAAAIQNVETVAVGLVCALATAAELSAEIMQEVSAGQSAQGTTNKIYVASGTICKALGGTLTGDQASNVKAVTSVS